MLNLKKAKEAGFQMPSDIYSKPLKCDYDPYTNMPIFGKIEQQILLKRKPSSFTK